jgi:hypothetical protein
MTDTININTAAHPFSFFSVDDEEVFMVQAGHNLVCAFEILPNTAASVKVVHTMAGSQDNSLRCWISKDPGGVSVEQITPEISFWHPRRKVMVAHVLYSGTPPEPSAELTTYNIMVEPGTYYLNVLNLVNSGNKFYASIEDVSNNTFG